MVVRTYFLLCVRYPTEFEYPSSIRINYYSSATLTDADGDRLGHETADNRRVLNERRFIFTEIGNEDRTDCPNNAKGEYGEEELTLMKCTCM